MNIQILGLLGILAVCTVSVQSYSLAEDVEEIEEFDEEDEWFDDEFEEDDDEEFYEEEQDAEEEGKESESSTSTTGRTVKSRETCDDIKKRVNELRADVVAHPELQQELDTLLVRQRACAPRANRRPVRNYDNINPVVAVEVASVEDVAAESPVVDADKKKAEKKKTKKEKVAEPEELEPTPEENIQKGLCADGTNPNRYGCCANERFKQVSTMVFACCPKEGDGECHEPYKTK